MNTADLLVDAFCRVRDVGSSAVEGLSTEQLTRRLTDHSNTIAWLVWHLARVQDDHVADVAGLEQVWISRGWAERFGLPFDDGAIGYGQSAAEVAQVRADAGLLTGYLDDVHAQTVGYVGSLHDADLDRVVDDAWDPPVTLGVRLVSVISDDLQHAGQAAYLRGIVG